jgi:hypothetical protein
MNTCLLCKERPADKTGSHIVPHFLLKRIENIEGRSGRDYEIGFVVQSFDTTSHFGRSVPLEKLDEFFGELTDKDLTSNKHPMIVDYFFCKYCEDRFAKIENEYASTLQKHDDKVYESGISSELGLLFWMSVVWRISVNKKSGVVLTGSQNEKLRRVLNAFLDVNLDQINFANLRQHRDAKRLSYRLMRSPGYTEKNGTHMVWHPRIKHPYSLIIDEFILFFAFKDNYNDYKRTNLFGLKDEIWDSPINKFNGKEQIKPINEGKLFDINARLIEEIKQQRIEKMDLFWDRLHVAVGGRGRHMPEKIKLEIMAELTSEEKKMGRKYNLEDLKNSTFKVLSKYAP